MTNNAIMLKIITEELIINIQVELFYSVLAVCIKLLEN